MKVAIFITIWISTISPSDLSNHFRGQPLSLLKSTPGITTVELYTPAPGKVPVFDEVPFPALIIEIDIDSVGKALALTESKDFNKLFTDKSISDYTADKINLEIVEIRNFTIPGHKTPPPRTAPLSFVVRYYGPTDNASNFVSSYIEGHPSLLAKLPGIRNVICYLPLNWRTTKIIDDDSLVIGNEVVFDDLQSLNAALASDVLDKSKSNDKKATDPKKSYGYSSHHAMHRELVYRRSED